VHQPKMQTLSLPDTWQMMQFEKRLDANTEGINKVGWSKFQQNKHCDDLRYFANAFVGIMFNQAVMCVIVSCIYSLGLSFCVRALPWKVHP